MGSSHSHLFKSPFSAKASHTKRRKTSSLGTTEKEEENNKKTKVMDKNTNNCHKEKIKSFNGATSLPPSPSYTANDTYKTKTVIVDGRRYQNYNTKYVLPNDDEEQDRLVQAVTIIFLQTKLFMHFLFFFRSILFINIFSMVISQLRFAICYQTPLVVEGIHRGQVTAKWKKFHLLGFWI